MKVVPWPGPVGGLGKPLAPVGSGYRQGVDPLLELVAIHELGLEPGDQDDAVLIGRQGQDSPSSIAPGEVAVQEQAHGRRLVAGRKRPEIDRGQQHLGILVGLEVDDEFIDLDGRSASSSSSSCSIPTTCPSCVTSVRTVLTPLIPVASAIP